MDTRKELPKLLRQTMMETVRALVEAGTLGHEEATNWVDNHDVNLVEEGEGKYRAEIVTAVVEAEEA